MQLRADFLRSCVSLGPSPVVRRALAGAGPEAERAFIAIGTPIGHPRYAAAHTDTRLEEARLLQELPLLPLAPPRHVHVRLAALTTSAQPPAKPLCHLFAWPWGVWRRAYCSCGLLGSPGLCSLHPPPGAGTRTSASAVGCSRGRAGAHPAVALPRVIGGAARARANAARAAGAVVRRGG